MYSEDHYLLKDYVGVLDGEAVMTTDVEHLEALAETMESGQTISVDVNIFEFEIFLT
ncbi:hypothetical protein Bhyg_10054 [Pseudolycoriella hygida]|uniref:Uncharacterized protein n=1 Tax=Pseudolycoriella hygida TaxID=35572 RepID=A0A9Q0MUE0_9DIPT|nr:hypothetical protein Bhyg_10054 [Pseudolycoriella hygida]